MNQHESFYPEFEMADAPMYFSYLYRAVGKAIDDIEHCNYGAALESLKNAQATSRSNYLHSRDK